MISSISGDKLFLNKITCDKAIVIPKNLRGGT